MNRARRNRRSAQRGGTRREQVSTTTELVKQTQALRMLVEQMKVGTGLPVPVTPDVPLIKLRRNKPYTITRSCNKGTISSQPNLETNGSLIFALSDLPGVEDVQALFDEYRLAQVIVRFVPVSGQSSNNAFHVNPLISVLDYDDGGTTVISSLYQYNSVMITPAGTTVTRVLNPRFALAAYSGSFTSYSQSMGYCDLSSPGIQWYGVKYAIAASQIQDILYSIECEYTITFRQTR